MTAVNVAKTFFASARKLSANDRGRVLDFVDKFMENPANPGLSLERVTDSRDSQMWAARITQGLRAIMHKLGDLHTLLYAGQHDDAYAWASRRRVEQHGRTGALQIVETTETVQPLLNTNHQVALPPPLFAPYDDNYLVSLGLPDDWLSVIRQVRSDDQLLAVAEKLPEEVAERLLAVASGELVTPPVPIPRDRSVADSADNLRRFWIVREAADLREVLEKPIEDWLRFLHPSQRELVTGSFAGPVKVTGAAGTGKTVVAMHRARHLAANGKRVLLTSFVTTLCKNIERNLQILASNDERSRITVSTVHSLALRLARQVTNRVHPVDQDRIEQLIERFQPYAGYLFDTGFLLSEWNGVVDPQGIATWDEYREASRVGRGKALNVRQRKDVWTVLGRVIEELERSASLPWSRICRMAREAVAAGNATHSFDAVVVDEVQDLHPQEIKFLAGLASANPGDLMLVGDAGQRIYPGGFSLRALGIDVRGRSRVLRINYRTTDQIRRFADRLLSPATDDFDEGTETRRSQSLLHGPVPTVHGFATSSEHDTFVVEEASRLLAEGLQPREIAVFARVNAALAPLHETFVQAGIKTHQLGAEEDLDKATGVHFGTMHRAKGLEFKVVFAVYCSQGTLPHAATLSRLKDPGDHDAALVRERQLLYVTLTRARDQAFVTWVDKPSTFLEGLESGEQGMESRNKSPFSSRVGQT